MSTQPNQSQRTLKSPSNGQAVDPPTTCTHKPDDFSQLAINKGQRRINYELVVVDQKLAKALEALKCIIAGTPGFENVDFDEFEGAISDVYDTSRKVAGHVPPGCDPS